MDIDNVAIIIRVGRLNYKNVVRDLLRSLSSNGHLDEYSFNLYLSVDEKLAHSEITLDENTETYFSLVRYIFDKDREAILSKIVAEGITSEELARIILLRKPYGYQINSALVCAISDGNQFAIHFDDDQGFSVPVGSNSPSLDWVDMDVVGSHIDCLRQGGSITSGPISGYVSPIPPQITKVVPRVTRKDLGELFQGGHEVIDKDSFINPTSRILSQVESENSQWSDIPNRHGYRWISPANMGVNLKIPFPIFFNPTGARGEDAFFAMSMDSSFKLCGIPAFIFHDPFLSYPGIYESDFPVQLFDQTLSTHTIRRFSDAVLGWIKYMPLFLFIRLKGNRYLYQLEIRRRKSIIDRVANSLSNHLQSEDFMQMGACLSTYDERVEQDYNTWVGVNSAWSDRILPWLVSTNPEFDLQ